MFERFRRWLNSAPTANPVERRQAPLLQIILLALITSDVLILALLPTGASTWVLLALLPLYLGSLVLIRRGRMRVGAMLLISGILTIIALNALTQPAGLSAPSLLAFLIPLALAGLVTGRRMLLMTAAVICAVVLIKGIQPTMPPASDQAGLQTPANPPSTPADPAADAAALSGTTTSIIVVIIIALITLFLDQFGASLRITLSEMVDREYALELAQAALEQRIQTEQAARAEAQRLQEAERVGRQQLEQTVAEYLAFVQRVGRGDLDQELPITYDGALGQLGLGLQQMLHDLHRLGAEAQQLQQAEVDNRRALEQAVATYLAFVQEIGAGKLAERISVSGNGALGSLGHGLNTMAERLHQLTTRVQQAAASIATSAAEILAATTQQSATAAEQAAAITQTTTTVEEVKQIALQTAEQAAQVAQASQQALTAARSGTAAVTQTVSGMDSIREQSDEIAQTILVLSERAQAISSIVTTVSELADQSNLLALNAAIEAARAGEQGKSFAVVAQHVRDLAERSKTATTQVRTILSQIQQATTTAIMVTEEGGKGVESGLQQAMQAGDTITHLAGEIEGGAHTNTAMAAAAQQQLVGVEQIGQAIGAIQQATQQTLTSTRQAERAAKDLNALAQDLQKMVAAYSI